MSNHSPSTDLERVRDAFVSWRATRTRQTAPIPESLRQAALALLDRYPMAEVCLQLGLRSSRLKHFLNKSASSSKPTSLAQPTFIQLAPGSLAPINSPHPSPAAACRLVLERPDGSRLSLTIPCSDWSQLDSLCRDFFNSAS